MRLLALICAEQCVIDGPTNRVSIFNLLEEVKSPTFPAALYLTTILTLWEREPTEEDIDASVVIRLNDTELFRNPLRVSFQGLPRCRAIAVLGGLTLPSPGLLSIEVSGGPDLSQTWRVNVEQPPAAV